MKSLIGPDTFTMGQAKVALVVTVVFMIIVAAIRAPAAARLTPAEPDHPASGIARLGKGGGFIWRSKDAMDEGLRLLGSGVNRTNPELIFPLLSCMPNEGDDVMILDMSFGGREVVVNSGNHRGCRGWTNAENVVP